MSVRIITTAAALAVLTALGAAGGGDLHAAGRGYGGSGQGGGVCINRLDGSGGTAVRPADSRRRDGTFLTTGVTANGSTVRPGNSQGLRDGSRLAITAPPPATPTP